MKYTSHWCQQNITSNPHSLYLFTHSQTSHSWNFPYDFLHQLPLYCEENAVIDVKTITLTGTGTQEPRLFSPLRDESRSTFLSLPRPHLLTSVAAAVAPKGTCRCWKMHSEDALEPCFLCQIPQMVDNQVWARDEDNQKNAFSKVCQCLGVLASLQLKRLISRTQLLFKTERWFSVNFLVGLAGPKSSH